MPPGPTPGGKIGEHPRHRIRADHLNQRKSAPAEAFSTASKIYAQRVSPRNEGVF
jgi:hypothetical protein